MKTIVLPILLGLLVWMNPTRSYAQMDPVLTGMIIDYTNKAKSQYNSQLKTMAAENRGTCMVEAGSGEYSQLSEAV